jgi:hypothetical protein
MVSAGLRKRKKDLKAWLQCVAFLAVLFLAVSSKSRLLDAIVADLYLTALLVGSAVVVFKTWWSSDATGQPTRSYCGWVSMLPRRVQFWVFAETDSKNVEQSHNG